MASECSHARPSIRSPSHHLRHTLTHQITCVRSTLTNLYLQATEPSLPQPALVFALSHRRRPCPSSLRAQASPRLYVVPDQAAAATAPASPTPPPSPPSLLWLRVAASSLGMGGASEPGRSKRVDKLALRPCALLLQQGEQARRVCTEAPPRALPLRSRLEGGGVRQAGGGCRRGASVARDRGQGAGLQ
eukprot:2220003-Pleurochrysis_carterae.AAC.3